MAEYIKFSVIIIILVLVQKSLMWLIALTEYQITPDIILIGVVYFGIRKGKIPGSVAGFFAGLFLDLLSFSFIGLSALSQATSGFISGFFNNENKIQRYTGSISFVWIVILSSLFNNLIYFSLYYQGTSVGMLGVIFKYVLPTSIYTAVLSVPVIMFTKRRVRSSLD